MQAPLFMGEILVKIFHLVLDGEGVDHRGCVVTLILDEKRNCFASPKQMQPRFIIPHWGVSPLGPFCTAGFVKMWACRLIAPQYAGHSLSLAFFGSGKPVSQVSKQPRPALRIYGISLILELLRVNLTLEMLPTTWTRKQPHCSLVVLSSIRRTRNKSRPVFVFAVPHLRLREWDKSVITALCSAGRSLERRTGHFTHNISNAYHWQACFQIVLIPPCPRSWRKRWSTFWRREHVALGCILGHTIYGRR